VLQQIFYRLEGAFGWNSPISVDVTVRKLTCKRGSAMADMVGFMPFGHPIQDDSVERAPAENSSGNCVNDRNKTEAPPPGGI
jgi:hypothetical protein